MSCINDAVRSAAKNAISECPVGFEARCKILQVCLQHRGSQKHWASDAAWALLHDAEFKASLPDGVGHTELQVGGTTLHKRYKRRHPARDVVDVDAPQAADNIADEPQEPPDLGAPSTDLGATSGDEGAIMKACPTCNTMVAACGWANHVENCQPVRADPLPPPPVNDKWPRRRCGVIRKTEQRMGVISWFLIVQLKKKSSPIPWMGEGTMLLMPRRIKRSLLMTRARCMEMTRRRALW